MRTTESDSPDLTDGLCNNGCSTFEHLLCAAERFQGRQKYFLMLSYDTRTYTHTYTHTLSLSLNLYSDPMRYHLQVTGEQLEDSERVF